MADLQEELKRRESRWSAASTRSRQKIEVLEEQNKELQEEVKLLEHYRLQQWREEEQAKVRYTPVKQCGDTSAVCDFTRVLVSLTELNNVCACAGLWRGNELLGDVSLAASLLQKTFKKSLHPLNIFKS